MSAIVLDAAAVARAATDRELRGKPAVVSQEAIDLMAQELAEIDAAGGLMKHGFKPGDTVVIDSGPLAGLRGSSRDH